MTRSQATETISQLGGKKFIAMTSAKSFVYGENGLQFSIGSGAKRKINKVVISLNDSDTYNMQFWSIKGVDMRKVAEHKNVYNDMIRNIFTFETGFLTSL